MKILAINSLYRPYSRGGAEVIFDSIVEELKKDNDVTILTTAPWSGMASMTPTLSREGGVDVYRYYPLNLFSFINIAKKSVILRLFWHFIDIVNVNAYFTTKCIINKVQPDLILTHNLKGIGYTTITAIRKSNIAHIHTLHDIQLVFPSGLRLYGQEVFRVSNPLTWLYKTITKIVIGSPKIVVSPSKFLKSFYKSHGFFKKSQFDVVPNPFESLQNQLLKSKSAGKTIFFYLGQLEPHKGITMLLEVFNGLTDKNIELHIAGVGSLEHQVRRAVEEDERISYLGRIQREELGSVFSQVDFTVLPTLCYENSPTVVLESLGYGIPVIVSDIGGAAEFVDNGKNGFVIPPSDKLALADAMEKAIATSNYEDMSIQARGAVSMLSMKNYIKRILMLID